MAGYSMSLGLLKSNKRNSWQSNGSLIIIVGFCGGRCVVVVEHRDTPTYLDVYRSDDMLTRFG